MNPRQAIAVGTVLVGVFFLASGLTAALGVLDFLAPLVVGAALLGIGFNLLKTRTGG